MRKGRQLPNRHDIAAAVRAELMRAGVSGVGLGQALGWTQDYVSRRTRGAVEFSPSELHRIAAYLDIPADRLFSPEPATTPQPAAVTP
jgi:transcriptional regulator with XRE-family HTH domain